MTKKKKNYNEKAPYLVKKARVKNDRPMCPKCSKCLNKYFCNHRRNLKLMNKCPDCHNVPIRSIAISSIYLSNIV